MKIYTAEQIYAADKNTMKSQGLTSDELMERAAEQLFSWMHARLQGAQVKINLFCGIGNNGGDGLALARLLKEHGYNIMVYVVNYSKNRSEDFLTNLERLKERKVWPEFLEEGSKFPVLGKDDIIVDAIFGIGLNRAPDDWVAKLFSHIEASDAFILAVDMPSGLFTDKVPDSEEAVLKANYTLSFQVPKLVFFLPQTAIFTDQWELLDIGLDQDFLSKTQTNFELIGKSEVLGMYIPRKKFSHKGTFGHSLIVGGSYGKIGAVHLASKACLLAGSGLVTAYVPRCGYLPLQTNLPEAMVLTDAGERYISDIQFDIRPSVVGIGVGIGKDKKTGKAFSEFLKKNTLPLVIDADGLNLLSENEELLKELPAKTVLTPHPKELERLIGGWKDDFQKVDKAKQFAKEYDCILLIKGAHTITLYNDKGYINTTGNPGMGSGGTGDVLTGIITGLIAQGYEPLEATVFGVYLHGRSADIKVEKTGYQSLTASNVIEGLGEAFLDLFVMENKDQDTEEHGQK
ncbi:NAD(P)H-hydrate dehydratase [Pareuzebyella sediminis]|uniref:NAD(P)H-hydrate dehydratase n=1 Tax=Pareuzebyella sediminis TaxID=2607998 RepID=UPI0011EEF2AB|nr:NAD(P)H-hydrate dehydratase [Pareuzebyella sediminis]